jgi:peptidoglycan-associated lipoprotein
MKLKTLLVVTFFIGSWIALAQPSYVINAKSAFTNGEYFEAAEQLTSAYQKVSPRNSRARDLKAELAFKAGYSYEMIFNDAEAENWYQRAIDLRYYKQEPDVHFRIANVQRRMGNYEKAKENYQRFLELVPEDPKAERALEAMQKAGFFKDNRTRYTVRNERKINTENFEMAPVVADRRGNVVAFGSTRKAKTSSGKDPIIGEPYFNIWQAEKDRSGNWTEPVLFLDADSLNTEYNEGTIAFDESFRRMFITRCPHQKKQNLGCQIWISDRRGRNWGVPQRVALQPHDSISIGHPCPMPDGNSMVFASDLPGGQGGMDLWYSTFDRRSGTWSEPVNLGPEINTPGDELFPTLALNGDLFFASNGHIGLGGLDIFKAIRQGDNMRWIEPENMGTPINSDADDYHLTEVDKRNGYFTSNRKGSLGPRGLGDIWSYELPPNLFTLKVYVNEIGSPDRIPGATIQVNGGGETFTGVTNAEGVFFWDKKVDGTRFINEETSYEVRILPLEGYHPSTDVGKFSTIGLEYDQDFIIEIPLLAKTPIVLPEVRYALARWELLIDETINSKDSLNFVVDLLEEYPGMKLKLLSHTDSRGTAQSNKILAEKRAQSCVDYLVNERGVDPRRLVAEGRGEDDPRTIFKVDGEYRVKRPTDGTPYEEILLTETYINQYKGKDGNVMFERLHQYNRRTEAEVIRMDWTPDEDQDQSEDVEID